MKTMNGFTNELLVKKAKRNWRTRCGAFLLAIVATWCGGAVQDAYGQATLTTNAGWGATVAIDTIQTQNRVAPLGNNIGYPYGYTINRNADKSITWAIDRDHPYGLDLADVASSNVRAYLLDTPTGGQGQAVRVGDYAFATSDAFAANGTVFTTSRDLTWTGQFNAGGIFNTQGHTLTTTGEFLNTGAFTINAGSTDNGGYLNITGRGSNTGNITIGTGGLRLSNNNFTNAAGTITIGNKGILALTQDYNLSGNVIGNGFDGATHRGMISLEGNAKYTSGNWSGSITVSGVPAGTSPPSSFSGYSLEATGVSSAGLNTLRVIDGANVIIATQDNVNANAQILLGSYGSISKHRDTGVLTLANDINFASANYGGQGNFNVYGTVNTQSYDADNIIDSGMRIILTGNVTSSYTYNKTFNVNAGGGAGAVSLQGNNSGYHGDYYIHSGTLEVDTGARLGSHGDPTQGTDYQIGIGAGTFRVVNTTDQTIGRFVKLDTVYSTYEVFTGDITNSNGNISDRHTMADASRLTVFQTGAISGSGSLNKAGDGRLVLGAASNSYTGDTIIEHGILSISNSAQINDRDQTKSIIIGSSDNDTDNYRPVFETTTSADPAKYDQAGVVTINKAKIQINQRNSVIRTTGAENETIINTEITSVVPDAMTAPPILNKEGAGTLTLNGAGNWGYQRSGETVIRQGTIQFSNKDNIAKGDITIGTDPQSFKDLEGSADDYKAVLKLTDNAGYQNLPNNIILGSASDSYIEVGTGSNLSVNKVSELNGVQSDLNKQGQGELILNGTASYSGWTNIEAGSITLTVENQIASSAGVDLIGENTTLDMTAADQTLKGLRGGMDPEYAAGDSDEFLTEYDDPTLWTRKILTGNKNLTLDIQNYKDGDDTKTNVFRGHIVGSGTVTKKNDSTLASGFLGFDGAFNIQGGTIQTLTDTTLTGLSGRAGTYLDVLGNTLTIKIDTNQAYQGTIVSSSPVVPYASTDVRPHIIKDGVGTLTAGFYDDPNVTGNAAAYRGDLTLKQGNIVSTTDYYMEGGGNLTFYANVDNTGNVTPLKLQVGENKEKRAMFLVNEDGDKTMVNVNLMDSATGWKAPKGNVTVGIIEGNSYSDYSGLTADTTNSLFHSIQLNQYTRTNGRDLYVDLNVTGFGGVGDTYNTIAVGDNLDGMRLTDLSNNNLASLLQDIWAAGSNIQDAAERDYRANLIRGIYQQLSADTIANATFMGLNRPWLQAFDRLNLDCQMVYLTPPGAAGPNCSAIANMRNLWFTPTVQSITARSDGNARKYSIERSGFQVGFDKRVAQNTSIGFMLGHDSPTLRQGDDRVEGNDFQFGLYAGTMVGHYVEMKGFIGFGHQNYKSNRNIYLPNDKIVPDGAGGYRPIGGTQRSMSAHGRFDGDTFQFSFEVARPLFLGFAILRPSIGLDSEHAYRYAFTETGDAAMRFNRSSVSRTKARFGMSLETCTFDRVIFTGRLGYSTLLGGKDYATATGQFVDVYAPNQTVRSVATGKSYFDAGVGTRIFLNPSKTLTLVGNYDASVADHWAEHVGSVGFQYIY